MAYVDALDELTSILRARERAPIEPDLASLEPRKREELEFHDRDRAVAANGESAAEAPNRRFYSTTRVSLAYIDNWLATAVPGKVFLDYGCGNGSMAIKAATLGAGLAIGIDISPVSIENARRDAAAAGVAHRCVFLQGDCEDTKLPAGVVDAVMCGGMLHHVDLTRAFPELKRVMRDGGRALAVEALGYNPLIQLYRRKTPDLRTEWEARHILSMRDVRLASTFFDVEDVRHWHLCSVAAAMFRPGTRRHAIALRTGEALDRVLLRVPGLKLMSWQFSFVMAKA